MTDAALSFRAGAWPQPTAAYVHRGRIVDRGDIRLLGHGTVRAGTSDTASVWLAAYQRLNERKSVDASSRIETRPAHKEIASTGPAIDTVSATSKRRVSQMPDWIIKVWDESPNACLMILVLVAGYGFVEITSFGSKLDDLNKSIQQTREQMIASVDAIRGDQSKSLSDVVRSNDQLFNAINIRVDRIEQRLKP